MRVRLVILTLLVACKAKPAKPLAEAILGEWETLCRTDAESKSACLGKEDYGLYEILSPDGTLEAGSRRTHVSERGRWQLDGDHLTLIEEGGGMQLVDEYRARMDGDHLVLWSQRGFGKVLGRVGAPFEPAATVTTSGKTSHAIGDVHYTITLPDAYRLARDDNNRQTWEPSSGAGFKVLLVLSPRAQDIVDGKPVTPPCSDRDYGGRTGASQTIDGVERDTDVSKSFCIPDSGRAVVLGGTHARLPGEGRGGCGVCTVRLAANRLELASRFASCIRHLAMTVVRCLALRDPARLRARWPNRAIPDRCTRASTSARRTPRRLRSTAKPCESCATARAQPSPLRSCASTARVALRLVKRRRPPLIVIPITRGESSSV